MPEAFWSRVQKSEGCWLWTGRLNDHGYGRFGLAGREPYAHHVSWVLHYGPKPAGAHVLHKCDVRNCVRPDHLFLGDQAVNSRDMWNKGRAVMAPHHRGEQHGRSRFTEDQVREMRNRRSVGETLKSIGADFGASPGTVKNIVSGKTWKHV